jgi:hypothetical protein
MTENFFRWYLVSSIFLYSIPIIVLAIVLIGSEKPDFRRMRPDVDPGPPPTRPHNMVYSPKQISGVKKGVS